MCVQVWHVSEEESLHSALELYLFGHESHLHSSSAQSDPNWVNYAADMHGMYEQQPPQAAMANGSTYQLLPHQLRMQDANYMWA